LRYNFKKTEFKRKLYKSIFFNQHLPKNLRFNAKLKLEKLNNNSSTQIKNICVISGRSRAVLKDFKLSRIVFKHLGLSGNIPGIKK